MFFLQKIVFFSEETPCLFLNNFVVFSEEKHCTQFQDVDNFQKGVFGANFRRNFDLFVMDVQIRDWKMFTLPGYAGED